jgi:hypothetical protein
MKNIKKFQINRISSLLTCPLLLHCDKTDTVNALITKYCEEMDKRISSNGPSSAVKFLKEVHQIAIKLAVGVPFEPLP